MLRRLRKRRKQSKEDIKNKRLLSTYGISLSLYKCLLDIQKNKCAICGNAPKNMSLNVDHRHVPKYKKLPPEEKKTEVRGLLCFRCNKFLVGAVESYKNARQVLGKLNAYFEAHKMKGD
jgi:hypothetical protein